MQIEIDQKLFEQFIEYEQIKKRVRLMGIQIGLDYEKKHPIFIGVLNGSFMFMGDLLKEIDVPLEVSFVRMRSYLGDRRQSQVDELIGLDDVHALEGRDVVIVEDIIDSGFTLQKILQNVEAANPKSVAVCTLLLKPKALQVKLDPLSYVGFEIENEFVVGYGMDFNGLGRNFPDIYREKP
jgi:hypoxanthine phosphoribosyltransferase